MQPTYAAQYRKLYENHWWWRSREEILIEVLKQTFPGRDNLKILDVGCGDGLFFSELKKFGTPAGVETVESLITEHGRSLGEIYVGELGSFNAPTKYDLILMLDVIEHLPDEKPLLVRARELLAPGGRLIITVPAFMSLWTHHDDLNQHCRRYNKGMLRDVLKESGFEVLRLQYLFAWPAVAKFMLHYLEMLRAPKNEETHIPAPMINKFLVQLCRFEYGCLKVLGAPFGSSVLAVSNPA